MGNDQAPALPSVPTPPPAPMTGPAGPHYQPGITTAASATVSAGRGNRLTLGHLRVLLTTCDDARLADDAVVTGTTSIGGKLTGLEVRGEQRPAANDTLTPQ